jgi:hypothetical protein
LERQLLGVAEQHIGLGFARYLQAEYCCIEQAARRSASQLAELVVALERLVVEMPAAGMVAVE